MSLIPIYKLILMRHEDRKLTTPNMLRTVFGDDVGHAVEDLERMNLIRRVHWEGEQGYTTTHFKSGTRRAWWP